MANTSVWAVILNWNLPVDTNQCVASLQQSDYSNLTVVVVDNGSTPENLAALTTEAQGAVLVRSAENLGFAGGCNLGIRYALDHGADYVFLINNDTTVAPDMLSRLVAAQEADPTLGVVGPLIYYADPADEVWFSGQRFWKQLYVVRRGLHLSDVTKPLEEADFISGCGMLAPRRVWEQVGLLAPEYFMYYEDLDFCIRAKKQGYRVACVPQAKMWHAVSKSSGGMDSPHKQRLQVQSSLIFFWRHTDGLWFVLNASIRIAHAGYSMLRALLRGTLKWATIREFIGGIAKGWKQRKA